jgi:hypothetical protein
MHIAVAASPAKCLTKTPEYHRPLFDRQVTTSSNSLKDSINKNHAEREMRDVRLELFRYGCPGIFLQTDSTCEYGEAFEEREASAWISQNILHTGDDVELTSSPIHPKA